MVGGHSVGGLTRADVEKRAHELALIDGRDEATDDDLARAQAELNGKLLPDAVAEDADAMSSRSRDPSDPPADRGRRAPESEANEEEMIERLALEGVEEAQHQQMVESRRTDEETDAHEES